MPTLLIEKGFKFLFYSEESKESYHVHVTKGAASGKIWLEPYVSVQYLYRFTSAEEKDVMEIVDKAWKNSKGNSMNISNKYDSLESLIYEMGLRISSM